MKIWDLCCDGHQCFSKSNAEFALCAPMESDLVGTATTDDGQTPCSVATFVSGKSECLNVPRRRPRSKKPEKGIEISYESVSTKPTQRIKFDPRCCELETPNRLWQRPKPVEPIRWRSMKIQAPNQLYVKIGCGQRPKPVKPIRWRSKKIQAPNQL